MAGSTTTFSTDLFTRLYTSLRSQALAERPEIPTDFLSHNGSATRDFQLFIMDPDFTSHAQEALEAYPELTQVIHQDIEARNFMADVYHIDDQNKLPTGNDGLPSRMEIIKLLQGQDRVNTFYTKMAEGNTDSIEDFLPADEQFYANLQSTANPPKGFDLGGMISGLFGQAAAPPVQVAIVPVEQPVTAPKELLVADLQTNAPDFSPINNQSVDYTAAATLNKGNAFVPGSVQDFASAQAEILNPTMMTEDAFAGTFDVAGTNEIGSMNALHTLQERAAGELTPKEILIAETPENTGFDLGDAIGRTIGISSAVGGEIEFPLENITPTTGPALTPGLGENTPIEVAAINPEITETTDQPIVTPTPDVPKTPAFVASEEELQLFLNTYDNLRAKAQEEIDNYGVTYSGNPADLFVDGDTNGELNYEVLDLTRNQRAYEQFQADPRFLDYMTPLADALERPDLKENIPTASTIDGIDQATNDLYTLIASKDQAMLDLFGLGQPPMSPTLSADRLAEVRADIESATASLASSDNVAVADSLYLADVAIPDIANQLISSGNIEQEAAMDYLGGIEKARKEAVHDLNLVSAPVIPSEIQIAVNDIHRDALEENEVIVADVANDLDGTPEVDVASIYHDDIIRHADDTIVIDRAPSLSEVREYGTASLPFDAAAVERETAAEEARVAAEIAAENAAAAWAALDALQEREYLAEVARAQGAELNERLVAEEAAFQEDRAPRIGIATEEPVLTTEQLAQLNDRLAVEEAAFQEDRTPRIGVVAEEEPALTAEQLAQLDARLAVEENAFQEDRAPRIGTAAEVKPLEPLSSQSFSAVNEGESLWTFAARQLKERGMEDPSAVEIQNAVDNISLANAEQLLYSPAGANLIHPGDTFLVPGTTAELTKEVTAQDWDALEQNMTNVEAGIAPLGDPNQQHSENFQKECAGQITNPACLNIDFANSVAGAYITNTKPEFMPDIPDNDDPAYPKKQQGMALGQ